MKPFHILTAALCPALLLAALPALADDALSNVRTAETPLTAVPTEWLGPTPHFVMMGSSDGTSFDIQIADIAALADVASFEGKREYAPDGTGYRYIDFEVALEAVLGGIERKIELEFENHDFNAWQDVTAFTLGTAEFPQGMKSNLELQYEWEAAGTSVNAELAGWDGTLTVHLDEGETDDKGLSGKGMIGGLVVAQRGADNLVISFTVPVAEYEIDD